jgi:methylmalonyl-CoA mutase
MNKSFDLHEFPPVSTEAWEEVLQKDLKGEDYKTKLIWETGEGIKLLPFYRQENLSDINREIRPISRSQELIDGAWEIREYVGTNSLISANRMALEALKGGANALYFDLPADSIRKDEDLVSLFEGIIIEIIGVHFSPSVSSPALLELFVNFAKNRNLALSNLRASFRLDPLSQALLNGKILESDEVRLLSEELLKQPLSALCVDASIYHNTGASMADELAFALAAGNEYLGYSSDLAKNLHFNFAVGSAYFLEIAKLRAFRLLWKQVTEAYQLKDSKTYVSAETSLRNKSTLDAHTNMLRLTTEGMSAAIGSADSLMIHPYDELFAESNSFSQRIARNIQHLLIEESYLSKVSDASQGSYYIETITDELMQAAWARFQEIEAQGGFSESLKKGAIQKSIKEQQNKRAEAFREQEKVMVGVNKYQPENTNAPESKPHHPVFGLEAVNTVDIDNVELFRYAETMEGAES